MLFVHRSYVKEELNGRQIKNKSNANAYFHYAILDKDAPKDEPQYGRASCVTLVPPYRVPPGDKYAVTSTTISSNAK